MSLGQLLEDIVEDAEECEDSIGTLPGPLSDPKKTFVQTRQVAIRANIASVLADSSVNNQGTANTSGPPATLPLCARAQRINALAALAESQRPTPDYELIGDLVKTEDWQIVTANGYAAKAGITV